MKAEINWQGLEKYLSQGRTFDEACRISGVDQADAKEYLEAKRSLLELDDDSSAICARSCLVDALLTLRELSTVCEDPMVRFKAAAELCELYRTEKKRLESKLRDARLEKAGPGEISNWIFRETTD